MGRHLGLGPGAWTAEWVGDGGPTEGVWRQTRAFVWPEGEQETPDGHTCLAQPSCEALLKTGLLSGSVGPRCGTRPFRNSREFSQLRLSFPDREVSWDHFPPPQT